MKAYAQKQSTSQQKASTRFMGSGVQPRVANHIDNRILYLQRTIGNQAVQRLLRAKAESFELEHDAPVNDFSQMPVPSEASFDLQTKPKVSLPGDIYEKDADRIADRVMNTPNELIKQQVRPREGSKAGEGIHTKQLADLHSTESIGVPTIVHEVLNSPGTPLDQASQDFIQPRLGNAFSDVRLHTDAKAAESARA